jgi:hypothetical protein
MNADQQSLFRLFAAHPICGPVIETPHAALPADASSERDRAPRDPKRMHTNVAGDLPDVSKCFRGIAAARDHKATLHGVVFGILVGSENRLALAEENTGQGRTAAPLKRRSAGSSTAQRRTTAARIDAATAATTNTMEFCGRPTQFQITPSTTPCTR